MLVNDLKPVRAMINIDDLVDIATTAKDNLLAVRDQMLQPWPRKHAPTVTGTRLCQLLGIERSRLAYLCNKGGYPTGTLKGNGRSREFTLQEAQEFIVKMRPEQQRPAGAPGVSICIGNFKGGVGKTTLAVALAQGLTLHGHKVCVIDLDPQASTTTLFGFVPDAEVTEEETVMPVVYGERPDFAGLAKPSYWANIDIIPAAPFLFGADYYLPNKQAKDPHFKFWEILSSAMAPLRKEYDAIIIDTPPTLSYLATASFMASDGMLVPVPPETLDYASSTQFWGQFAELFASLRDAKELEKEFAFIKVIMSKVKSSASTDAVKSWIRQTYPRILAQSEIPATDLVSNASAEFKTIYDVSTYDGSSKTYLRAVTAFDAMVTEVEKEMQISWEPHRSGQRSLT